MLDDELEFDGLLPDTVGMRLVCVAVRSADSVLACSKGTLDGFRSIRSLATDSLRSSMMVAEWIFAAYSAAMLWATEAMQGVFCCS